MLVYSINRQIQQLTNQLSFNSARIAELNVQIERLKEALSTLSSIKRKFIGQSVLCLQPEHTIKTLHGDHEKSILMIQESRLKIEFLAIPTTQLRDAEGKILQRINELEVQIQSLRSANVSYQSRQQRLYTERAEVMRNAKRN